MYFTCNAEASDNRKIAHSFKKDAICDLRFYMIPVPETLE